MKRKRFIVKVQTQPRGNNECLVYDERHNVQSILTVSDDDKKEIDKWIDRHGERGIGGRGKVFCWARLRGTVAELMEPAPWQKW